jgi:hypothetical protein
MTIMPTTTNTSVLATATILKEQQSRDIDQRHAPSQKKLRRVVGVTIAQPCLKDTPLLGTTTRLAVTRGMCGDSQ